LRRTPSKEDCQTENVNVSSGSGGARQRPGGKNYCNGGKNLDSLGESYFPDKRNALEAIRKKREASFGSETKESKKCTVLEVRAHLGKEARAPERGEQKTWSFSGERQVS